MSEASVQQYREDRRSGGILGQARRGRWLYYVSTIGHVWGKGMNHDIYHVLLRHKVRRD